MMRGALGACLPAAGAVLSAFLSAATPVVANPHVWVESRITFELEDSRVEALTFEWRFDDFYSAYAIRTHDLDGDGVLAPEEVQGLRAGSFDPLARFGYHVHVWVGGARREEHTVERFSARVEDGRLVIEFSVPVTPPADPAEGAVVVSLFDGRNEVDFRFAESNFLLADGEVGSDCRFRIARGRGDQAGHSLPVTLACGG